MDELLPRKAKPHTSPDIGIFPLRYRHYTLWRNKALNWEAVSEHQLFVWFVLFVATICLGSPPVQLRFTLNLSSVLNWNKQYRLYTIEHLTVTKKHVATVAHKGKCSNLIPGVEPSNMPRLLKCNMRPPSQQRLKYTIVPMVGNTYMHIAQNNTIPGVESSLTRVISGTTVGCKWPSTR